MKKILLLTVLFVFGLLAKAQVFTAGMMLSGYNDITPDTLLNYTTYPYTHETYSINIFSDPANDIELTAHGAVSSGGSGAYIKVTSVNPNVFIAFGRLDSVFVPANSNWNVTKIAKPLNAGEIINASNAVWDNTLLYLTDHSGSGGGNKNVNDWVGGDKYIGLKFQNGNNISYGWIRVKCKKEDSCYVKDYSYTTQSTGVKEVTANKTFIYPNPVGTVFYLKGINASTFDVTTLKLIDLLGEKVKFTYEVLDKDIRIELDPDLPAGSYLLQYSSGDGIFSKRFVKTIK